MVWLAKPRLTLQEARPVLLGWVNDSLNSPARSQNAECGTKKTKTLSSLRFFWFSVRLIVVVATRSTLRVQNSGLKTPNNLCFLLFLVFRSAFRVPNSALED
jgi:hypothetical protein